MSTKHRRSNLATTAGIILTAALALTACGSDESEDNDDTAGSGEAPDVEISYDISGDTEEVQIDGELELDQPTAWVMNEGDGDPVADGDLVELSTASVDVESQEVRAHDFDAGGSAMPVNDQLASQFPQVHEALTDVPLGSDIAFYMPADSLGEGFPAQLDIMHVDGVVPNQATGEPTDPANLDDRLPEVTLDEDTQAPAIETPEGDPPEELVVDVLKQGDGAEVQENSSVTVQYRGISWSSGEEFDSSWGEDNTGQPITFGLDQVISGWQEGMTGHNVGSQIMISIPPDQAYGEAGTDGIEPNETLVFVVDIVHSADPLAADESEPAEEPTE